MADNERLFGFELVNKEVKSETVRSPVKPEEQESVIEVQSNLFGVNAMGAYLDVEASTTSENAQIEKYREISSYSEVDRAISEIVSDAIIVDENKSPISLSLDDVELSESIKRKMHDEFDRVLNMLHFKTKGSDIFKRWYIDGRINYHMLIDENAPRDGIKEIRYIDPKKIKKIRKIVKKHMDAVGDQTFTQKEIKEFYLYNEKGVDNKSESKEGVSIATDSIAFASSGLYDSKNKMILSYLHKAIRPANQLRMLEDAVVIYRITRAPERRVFYIETGGLNNSQAQQHINNIMEKHKTKVVYDATTGEVKDSRRHLAMTEDYWAPRRDGVGTSVDTLQSGQNLSQIEDVEYFRNKLLESLNVPKTRFSDDSAMFGGRGTEISRDELKFARFISMLRGRFNSIFDSLLGTQLALRGIMTIDEWAEIKNDAHYDYSKDNHFTEAVENDILESRLRLLRDVESYIGTFFPKEWVMKNVLRMQDEEIADQNDLIKKESGEQPKDDEAEKEDKFPVKEEVDEIEPFEPSETLTEEEKELLNSMTAFFTGSIPEDNI